MAIRVLRRRPRQPWTSAHARAHRLMSISSLLDFSTTKDSHQAHHLYLTIASASSLPKPTHSSHLHPSPTRPLIDLPTPTMAPLADYSYTHFLISSPGPYLAHVEINRPSKLNSFHEAMWLELRAIFDRLSHDPSIRAVIFSGAGDRAFSAGLDVVAASQTETLKPSGKLDPARR